VGLCSTTGANGSVLTAVKRYTVYGNIQRGDK
jgi:hypothetical protein